MKEEITRNIDVLIQNLTLLKEQYENLDDEDCWWFDEYGASLVWQIACHPVFADSTPCLNEERGVEYEEDGWHDNCQECKAKWLMEEYE